MEFSLHPLTRVFETHHSLLCQSWLLLLLGMTALSVSISNISTHKENPSL